MARRITALILMLVLSVATFTGCGAQQCHYEELTFTLPKDFASRSQEAYAEDFDFLFENGIVAIAGIRETKQALAHFGTLDTAAYTKLVIEINQLSCEPVQTEGIWCFSYEAVSHGTPMTYICSVYEADESFWQIQAYCATADFATHGNQMWELILSMDAA